MKALLVSLQSIPPVPIDIECGCLKKEQQAVGYKRREKDIWQIGHQFGVQTDQKKKKNPTK